jgi:hypothetical protein
MKDPDPTSPEVGWSTAVGPKTEALIRDGLPITSAQRAAAAQRTQKVAHAITLGERWGLERLPGAGSSGEQNKQFVH